MPDAPAAIFHPSVVYQDDRAALEWLEKAFGFEVSLIVGHARPPKRSEVVSLLGSHPISRTFFPCCAIMYDRFARAKLLPMPPFP